VWVLSAEQPEPERSSLGTSDLFARRTLGTRPECPKIFSGGGPKLLVRNIFKDSLGVSNILECVISVLAFITGVASFDRPVLLFQPDSLQRGPWRKGTCGSGFWRSSGMDSFDWLPIDLQFNFNESLYLCVPAKSARLPRNWNESEFNVLDRDYLPWGFPSQSSPNFHIGHSKGHVRQEGPHITRNFPCCYRSRVG
jgi:hypothetical protein